MAIKRPTYQDYDEYIIDYDTTNASFIAMASILYRKGVKNYNFFLKLYDEDLVGVDPFDPTLSTNMKMKIIYECKRNFWYFCREVMVIPGTGRFELHRGNLAASWALLNNIPTYMVLPRQHGKTWLVITYALWVFNFASNYTDMLFMNKQLKDSQKNLKRFKDARDALPDYLQMKTVDNGKGEMVPTRSNVNSVTNGLKNEITVSSSARNPISADELGRGLSVAWVWIDELAFVQFLRIIYAAMMPAFSKASEVARSKGKPIACVLTTTPGDLAVDHGNFAHEIKENSGMFYEGLYDMDSNEISTWMSKNSTYGYIYIEFKYYQLNHADPDAWFAEQCKALAYNWPKIRREILLQWNSASSNSPFSEEDIKELRSMMINESDAKSIMINKYYRLNVYRELNPNDKYLICVDPAKGRQISRRRGIVICHWNLLKLRLVTKAFMLYMTLKVYRAKAEKS